MAAYKFGHLVGADDRPYAYPNVYSIERTTGPLRLAIAPARDHVGLMEELARQLPEPLGLLYVLVVSLADHELGRYQSTLLSREDVGAFLSRFRAFLEGDGRHNLWLMSPESHGTIVYDKHNILLAYGPVEAYEGVLRARGFAEGEVRYPVPHSHHYHGHFDAEETALLESGEWRRFPLVEEVDDP